MTTIDQEQRTQELINSGLPLEAARSIAASETAESSGDISAHTHVEQEIIDLQTSLSGKAALAHTHDEADVVDMLDAVAPTTQAFGDAAASGSASTAAHRDHKHGMMAAPMQLALGTSPSTQAFGDSAAGGSATDAAKTDHKHGMMAAPAVPSLETLGAAAASHGHSESEISGLFDSTVPSTQAFGDSAASGAATTAAKRDHKHAMPAAPVGFVNPMFLAGDLIVQDAVGADRLPYVADGKILKGSGGLPAWADSIGTIVAVFDGGGSAISGNPEVNVTLPEGGTITSWTLLADAAGSAVIDIWKCTYAQYDGSTHPAAGDKIDASALPTLSSAIKATDSTLTGWTKTLAAGDILRFHLNSSATVKRLELTLTYKRS